MKHLILFDDPCPLCNRWIQLLLKIDHKKIFAFAPLSGSQAQKYQQLYNLKCVDSLILIENHSLSRPKFHIKSRAIFKILWLMGGFYKLVGWKFILPPFMFDWGYDLVAKRRYQLVKNCSLDYRRKYKDRFLS